MLLELGKYITTGTLGTSFSSYLLDQMTSQLNVKYFITLNVTKIIFTLGDSKAA